jgi:hypothetical protein
MEEKNVKKLIIALLKEKKHVTLEEFLDIFDSDDHDEVMRVLEGDLKDFLIFDENRGGYRFRFVFGKRPQEVSPNRVRFSQVTVHPPVEAEVYEDVYTVPEIANLAHLNQDEVGDCVGCSGASLSKLMRVRILKAPTPKEQLENVKYGVTNEDGVLVDVLPDDTVSAYGIYTLARARLTPVPALADEGALITDGVEVLFHDGIVPEWMWPTSRTDAGQYVTPPKKFAELVKEQLPLYRFKGDWTVLDGVNGDPTTQIQKSCKVYGGCWMAMPVFDNCNAAIPSGDFPDPVPGVSRIVGYHAVVLVGWIRDSMGRRRWQFVNSWRDSTPLINTISDEGYMKPYFGSGHIQMITVMSGTAVPFIEKPAGNDPVPLPDPKPTPDPEPAPVVEGELYEKLVEAISAFLRWVFQIKGY